MKSEGFEPELKRKLEVIEESASKIRDVTQKLLRLTSARTVDYIPGTSMIDLSAFADEDDSPKK